MDEISWILDGAPANYQFINEATEQRIRELAYLKWQHDVQSGLSQRTSEQYWHDAREELCLPRELRISDIQSTDTLS